MALAPVPSPATAESSPSDPESTAAASHTASHSAAHASGAPVAALAATSLVRVGSIVEQFHVPVLQVSNNDVSVNLSRKTW